MPPVPPPVADDPYAGPTGGSRGMLIPDRLEMLVTGDPVAELDAALSITAVQLQDARRHGDAHRFERLARWMDMRLDQRSSFASGCSA